MERKKRNFGGYPTPKKWCPASFWASLLNFWTSLDFGVFPLNLGREGVPQIPALAAGVGRAVLGWGEKIILGRVPQKKSQELWSPAQFWVSLLNFRASPLNFGVLAQIPAPPTPRNPAWRSRSWRDGAGMGKKKEFWGECPPKNCCGGVS